MADAAVTSQSAKVGAPLARAAPEASANTAIPTPQNALLEAALRYAKRGWPVIPIFPRDKRPLTRHGLNDASTDRAQIRRWWDRYPNANIGVALWRARLVVIDVDGDHGRKSLADLTREYGALPPTLESKTGRGAHYYFRGEAQSTVGKLGPGLDVRASGSYIVAPPSLHASGVRYTWTQEMAPAPLPDWLRAKLSSPQPSPAVHSSVNTIPEGQRNAVLTSLAGTMRRRGLSVDAIAAALLTENVQRCRPPLPEAEVRRIAASVARYSPSGNATPVPSKANGDLAVMRRASEIEPRAVRWLWPGRIALGKVTLFAGDPGEGKTCVAVDIAARVSAGSAWPDGGVAERASVIMVSGEDDPEDTLVPRLIAAGGDRSRVHFLEGTRCVGTDGKQFDRPFTLADISTIEDGLRQAGNARLVIIDPVSAYLNDTDAHRNEQVRALLSPLAALAAARGTAILLITHLAKAGASALYRAIGSIGFVAAARAGWVFGREKGDPERRVMVALKNNLAADQGGLGYALAMVPVEMQGRRIDVVRVSWQPGPVNMTADQLLESESAVEHTERMEACDWLRETLGPAGVEAKSLKDLARDCGLAWITVRRAADRLGVRHRRQGFGPGSRVLWELPPHSCSVAPIGVIDAHPQAVSKYDPCEHVCDRAKADSPRPEAVALSAQGQQTAPVSSTSRPKNAAPSPTPSGGAASFQEGEL